MSQRLLNHLSDASVVLAGVAAFIALVGLTARREVVREIMGVGAFIQAAGLVGPFTLSALAGIPGAIAGVILMVVLFSVGYSKARTWRCGRLQELHC